MDEQKIFRAKAIEGYTVCFADRCPLKERCLRWKVGLEMPADKPACNCVNPHYQDVGTEQCPRFRQSEKVMFAKGMLHVFTEDMPKKVSSFVRQHLINSHCRTYYFEYRNGQRLMSPAVQEETRQLFREAGWNEEIQFDSYIKDYEW